jgi:hypothetical protein
MSAPTGDTTNSLVWHWGGDRRVHSGDCGAEVYVFKDGLVCSKCGATSDE